MDIDTELKLMLAIMASQIEVARMYEQWNELVASWDED